MDGRTIRIKFLSFVCALAGMSLLTLVSAASPLPRASDQSIAVQDSDFPDVEVALLEVTRTPGNTVTVKWQYRNKGPKQRELQAIGMNEADHYKIVAAAYLVDPANKKKYLIVRDTNDVPLGSRSNNYRVPPKDALAMWAKFPAPPETTEKVSVFVPHSAPFDDVKLAR